MPDADFPAEVHTYRTSAAGDGDALFAGYVDRLFGVGGPEVAAPVGDLLAAGPARTLVATQEWLDAHPDAAASEVITVDTDELRRVSFLQHPQQVMATFPLPVDEERPEDSVSTICSTLCLALDGIQDPGNLGTIIRIADWFGIDTIVCSPDTADAWSPKVVQATMGSIARVRIVYTDLQEYLSKATVPICGTLLDGENIYAQKLPQEAIIVMGNEGNGISPAIRQLVTHRLLIPPFRPGAESLNVAIATAITCSEFRRRTE